MKWQLVIVQGRHKGRAITITRTPFWIGHDRGCQVRIASAAVSGRHCAFTVCRGKLSISDGQTTGGSFVNGLRLVQKQELKQGDRLQIGPLVLVVSLTALEGSRSGTPDEDAIGQMLLEMDITGT